jgi:hypothetical protein
MVNELQGGNCAREMIVQIYFEVLHDNCIEGRTSLTRDSRTDAIIASSRQAAGSVAQICPQLACSRCTSRENETREECTACDLNSGTGRIRLERFWEAIAENHCMDKKLSL